MVLVTGANGILGYNICLNLLKKGANICVICRDEEKTNNLISDLTKKYNKAKIIGFSLDFANINYVKEFFNDFKVKIDYCVLNAATSVGNYDYMYKVNTLASIAIYEGLKSLDVKFCYVCSISYKKKNIYKDDYAYTKWQTMNYFYYNDQANLVNFAHPGLVMSKLFLERRKHKCLMKLIGLFLPKAKINSFTVIKALIMKTNKRYIITPNFFELYGKGHKRKLNKKYFKEEKNDRD